MSKSRTIQIALAVTLVSIVSPNILTLSVRDTPSSVGIRPTETATAATTATATEKVTRLSHLARHSSCNASAHSALSYNYPIKPFRRQHPIRGYFGDPRTPVGRRAVYAPGARGLFNFHNGVDIVAAANAPVYPVVSGVARVNPDNVIVSSNDGRWFQYYHLWPSVHSGQYVVAYKTVLGRVRATHEHVHLTEVVGGRVQNPLAPGHLEPYRDKTLPVVDSVHFADDHGRQVNPLRLKGLVHIATQAHDMPALPVLSNWPGLGVTAATVAWDLRRPGGKAVIRRQTVADFRQTVPDNQDFWKIYAAGTHQNKFGYRSLQRVRLVGLFSYDLTPSGLDTRAIPNGTYKLTVAAADTCGNSGSLSEQIEIAN
ncbi:MAG: M23 family metallopeptidase [Gaiellaceae bacterium]